MSYQRRKVIKALLGRGFSVLREGAAHTIVGQEGGKRAPVPRHTEINRLTARSIARTLDLNWTEFERDIR